MTTEDIIEEYIEKLDLSREEAIALMNDDIKVDKMTSTRQIDSDLTEEQKRNAKAVKVADRRPTVYKFDSNRKRKPNEEKQELLKVMIEAIEACGTTCEIINKEREFKFTIDDKTYKVVLSQPRK